MEYTTKVENMILSLSNADLMLDLPLDGADGAESSGSIVLVWAGALAEW